MTETEQKAIRLRTKIQKEYPDASSYLVDHYAICRSIDRYDSLRGGVNERIEALQKRERVCWDMSEVFLHAKDAHGLHDMGVEIQGIQWAIRELEGLLRK